MRQKIHFAGLLPGVAILSVASLQAAPLTWFPGPSLGNPVSGAATVVSFGYGNVIIGGTTYYGGESLPENLVVTNLSWSYLPVMLGVSIAGGAANGGDFIIVYGGTDGETSQSTVLGYSPSGDTPATFASMSVPRSYLGYAADRNGNAYAIGGLDDTGQPLASAERFSPESGSNGTWSAIASLPAARYNFPAVFDHTNEIYVFGGYTNPAAGGEIASVLRYSTAKNAWTNLAAMPVAVAGSAAAYGADGNIYVAGGLSGGVATSVVQIYNPAANTWTVSTPLPESLNASAMGVDSEGRLIMMGGMDVNSNDVADVWRSQQLGVPDTAPVLTQLPGTNVAYAALYTSSITATGNPQPVYLLVDGPTNMTVDYFSGAISWTPQGGDQIGNIAVTIAATNYAGATNWTFAIVVPPPPPTVPTNFVVVSTTDNSVTLSWSPEDPLVGPVTYKVYRVTSSGGRDPITYYTLMDTTTNDTATISLPNINYSYTFVVTATAASGLSTAYSARVSTRTTGPQAPQNVRVTGLTSSTLTLAWDPAPGPEQSPYYSPIASYTISHYQPFYGGYTLTPEVTGIPTNTTYGTVTGLTPGSSAFWIVQAIDTQGNASSAVAYILAATNPIPVGAQISASGTPASGGFQFSVSEGGAVLQTVLILASTNPADASSWEQIGSVLPGANPFTFTDTNAAQYPMRFYRILSQ